MDLSSKIYLLPSSQRHLTWEL